jgi:hypothetical protein
MNCNGLTGTRPMSLTYQYDTGASIGSRTQKKSDNYEGFLQQITEQQVLNLLLSDRYHYDHGNRLCITLFATILQLLQWLLAANLMCSKPARLLLATSK